MIAWSISVAEKSQLFDRIIVSTDDQEIADISREYGAEVPFVRPSEISGDLAGIDEVLIHTLNWLEIEKCLPDYLCCIYPCAPLLTGADISSMFLQMKEGGFATSLAATCFPFPIWRSIKINQEGKAVYQWPEHRLTRSQDLPEMFHDAGQCYWLNVEQYRKDPRFVGESTLAFPIPRWKAHDIDNEDDWLLVESIFSATS
jgi:pseudaminic acid cytidylyltransferase